jgi:hypothetical protein
MKKVFLLSPPTSDPTERHEAFASKKAFDSSNSSSFQISFQKFYVISKTMRNIFMIINHVLLSNNLVPPRLNEKVY